jgi:suppressor of G2 allele of SKP1
LQFTVSFPLSGGSDFSFSIDPLSQDIDPSTSTYEILSTKISLKLVKATRGLKWLGLEGTPSDSKATIPTKTDPAAPSKGIAYPTSSRKGVKDWDAIEREIVKEAETWEKPEGDAAANALFRDLFKSASPEMRMAMEKSYVESNGTALSTNWDEVRKGRVETHPPDSMVAKKWGG